MNYQDRDRLNLSIILSALLHGLFLLLAYFLPWERIVPDPDFEPLILVELEEFAPLVAAEPPPSAPEASEPHPEAEIIEEIPIQETRVPDTPAKASRTPPPAVSPPETRPPQPPPVRQETIPPEPRISSGALEPPTQIEPPLSGRAASFLAGPPRRDEALEAELRFLEEQKQGLSSWLRDNPVQKSPPPDPEGTQEPMAPIVEGTPDPEEESRRQLEEELAQVEAAIADLKRRSAGPGATRPEAAQAEKSPAEPERRTSIRDERGQDIGVGVLGGRDPRGGLALALFREDFGGEPPPETQIFAEFDILDSGLVEPSSLKISGDTRYTNAVEKIRAALRGWNFSPAPGTRTRARIVIIIKSSDVR